MGFAGALADVTKSVGRLYINNFVDKGRQNTMDLLLGRTAGQQQVVLHDPINDYVTVELTRRVGDFSSTRNIKVFAGTFNLNGVMSPDDLSGWLFPPDGGREALILYLLAFKKLLNLHQVKSSMLNHISVSFGKHELQIHLTSAMNMFWFGLTNWWVPRL